MIVQLNLICMQHLKNALDTDLDVALSEDTGDNNIKRLFRAFNCARIRIEHMNHFMILMEKFGTRIGFIRVNLLMFDACNHETLHDSYDHVRNEIRRQIERYEKYIEELQHLYNNLTENQRIVIKNTLTRIQNLQTTIDALHKVLDDLRLSIDRM